MKNKMFLVLCALIVACFSLNAQANDHVIAKMSKADEAKVLNVQLANFENERTRLSLFDVNGISWYHKHLDNLTGYFTSVDLNGLPEGDYFFMVKRGDHINLQAISFYEDDLDFFANLENTTAHKGFTVKSTKAPPIEKSRLISKFRPEGYRLLAVQLANILEGDVKINLASPNYGIWLSEAFNGENAYAKTWNLTGMPEGLCYMHIETEDVTVIQFFMLTEEGIELLSKQSMERSDLYKVIYTL